MSEKQMQILVQAFTDMNDHDLAAVRRTWHDDVTFTFPGGSLLGGTYEGADDVERCLWTLQQLMPDMKITVVNTFDGSDIVCAEWIKTSTAPDGTAFENRGVTIAEFEDDLVIRMRDHMDTEALAKLAPPRRRRRDRAAKADGATTEAASQR